MSRKKLERFEHIKQLANCYCPFEEPDRKALDYFEEHDVTGSITLELACGSGAYTLELARRFPERRIIGVDIKGARLWYGATGADEEGLRNAMFIRQQIELLPECLEEGSIEDIWITFPDPFLADRRAHKRLTAPRFMEMYRKLLVSGGTVRLKTDSYPLYEFTKETWLDMGLPLNMDLQDIYAMLEQGEEVPEILTSVQTTYEQSHLKEGRKIYYLETSLT